MDNIKLKKALITGAGGFVGGQLAQFLADKGIEVNAMHRPESKINAVLENNPLIHPTPANLIDLESLTKASKGCDVIFHLAAYAQPFAKDMNIYYDMNVQGTINVLEAAKTNNVTRVVVTATAGTFGPQIDDSLVTEDINQTLPPFTEYERTKLLANEKVAEYVANGMNVVIVSPTRVFGPGVLSTSNAITRLLEKYIFQGISILPGNGRTTGNYAYVKDMINGHYLAAIKGKTGENYILGGENMTYRELMSAFAIASSIERRTISLPIPLMLGMSKVLQFFGNTIGITPIITPKFVRKYVHNWATDISKAKNQLGYTVTPFTQAIKETADWIIAEHEAN